MNLNPALSGNFEGDYRLIGDSRSQWHTVTRPYQTVSISADAAKIPKLDGIRGGILINQDRAGDSRLNTFQCNLSAAYVLSISDEPDQVVAFSVQPGLTNKRIDYSDLSFDNQYVGYRYDPTANPNEPFSGSGLTYFNLNVGAYYNHPISERKRVGGGLAFHNLSSPRQSFYHEADIRLDPRWTVHADANWPLADRFDILPRISLMGQGTFRSFVSGLEVKYELLNFETIQRSLLAGVWYRNTDAIMLTAGMMYDDWKVTFSYDVNVSSLIPASRFRGAVELSAIYIFGRRVPQKTRHRVCPDYM